MNIPQESEIRDSRRQPRKWPHVRTLQLGGMAAIPIAIGVIWVVVGFKATSTLWKARADADRLDPGWRFADIVKQQAIIPDRLNSAIQVRLVFDENGRPISTGGEDRAAVRQPEPGLSG